MLDELTKLIDLSIRKCMNKNKEKFYFPIKYALGIINLDKSKTIIKPGKSIRPLLCITTYSASKIHNSKFIQPSLSLEYIHNFSLIHDDIQDNDEFRHNKPTVWKVWGKPKALTFGNILHNLAYLKLSREQTQLSKEQIIKISQILNSATLEMIEGQYLDIHFETEKNITENQYLNMISKKTGALLSASVNIGSVIGNYKTKDMHILNKFSESLGYLFQITDDILGIWGNSSKTGKPVGSDIINRKKSLPIIHCKNQLNHNDLIKFEKIYSSNKTESNDVEKILDFLNSTNTKSYLNQLTIKYYESCIEYLDETSLNEEKITPLKFIVENLVSREK